MRTMRNLKMYNETIKKRQNWRWRRIILADWRALKACKTIEIAHSHRIAFYLNFKAPAKCINRIDCEQHRNEVTKQKHTKF